jgi:hypothetical protein
MGLYDTTGNIQHVFAVHQADFLAGGLVLLVFSAWWGLHRLATATCLSDGGCVLKMSWTVANQMIATT